MKINVKTNKLTNCSNFVFSMGDMDCFFLIPTNKVQRGDIIIANATGRCEECGADYIWKDIYVLQSFEDLEKL